MIPPLNLAHTTATRAVAAPAGPRRDDPDPLGRRVVDGAVAAARSRQRTSSSPSKMCPMRSRLVRRYSMFSGLACSVERDAVDDVETEALEAAVLDRVVGHEAHGGDAEVDEDLGTDAVLAVVDGQAELQVGVDGVVALLLEVVGPQLVGQADAATLVAAQVDDDAGPLLGDQPQRPRAAGARSRSAATRRRPRSGTRSGPGRGRRSCPRPRRAPRPGGARRR